MLFAVVLGAGLAAAPAPASPTGLNNIPTADVVPQNVLVLQGWANFDGDTSWFAGFKVGPAENVEVGLDDDVAGAGSATGITFQAKYRIPLPKRGGFALGLANVSADTDVNGEYFPYAVVTAPLDATANGTVGYSFQEDNHALFLGADAAVSPALTLRADWTQTDDGDESVSSLGFISPITDRFLIESWASFPTGAGAETNYVVKGDYVIPLR